MAEEHGCAAEGGRKRAGEVSVFGSVNWFPSLIRFS